LHFHGLDDEEPLPRLNLRALRDEHADNLAGHGRNDSLSAFESERAAAPAVPRAWIDHLNAELLPTGVNAECFALWLNADFKRISAEQYRVRAGCNFDGVGRNFHAVETERHARARSGGPFFALQLDPASAFANADVKFHCVLIFLHSISRRAIELLAAAFKLPV
jgi:hypothetical protein